MKINDVVYESVEVNEPVLIALIESKPLQRLKNIEQYGIPKEYYLFPGFSRYDHCVGAMLLLRKLGASLEEQVAGLLHDVSHTAFSHVIDWVIGDPDKEDFQDKTHKEMISKSEIPEILSKFGFDMSVTDIEKYSLLESELPNLCADRVDYALKEFHYWTNPEIVKLCLDSLRIYDGKMVFSSKAAAEAFGRNFMRCQMEHWGSTDTVVRYHLFSKLLKIGLDEKIIFMEDFYHDDSHVIGKLKAGKNLEINKMLNILSSKKTLLPNEDAPQTIKKKKFRYVDPEYVENDMLHRLSEADERYKDFLVEQRKINDKGVNVNLSI
ncbi:MAG: HD domain-containing protein [Candidatus Aenigmarchaeota archaeon]|nr:HD domain-containing protein [Candidatus Aenigmarchaeota archaeon]